MLTVIRFLCCNFLSVKVLPILLMRSVASIWPCWLQHVLWRQAGELYVEIWEGKHRLLRMHTWPGSVTVTILHNCDANMTSATQHETKRQQRKWPSLTQANTVFCVCHELQKRWVIRSRVVLHRFECNRFFVCARHGSYQGDYDNIDFADFIPHSLEMNNTQHKDIRDLWQLLGSTSQATARRYTDPHAR